MHMNPPDIRIFSKAKDIKYLGTLNVEKLLEWVTGKLGIPENRIAGMAHLKQKLSEHPERNLVLFMSYQDKAE